jgi:hypothetical protein
MTDQERLAQIEARAEAASAGPWETTLHEDQRYGTKGYAWVLAKVIPGAHELNIIKVCHEDWPPTPSDAEFIAHARQDIPWLLQRLREAETQ